MPRPEQYSSTETISTLLVGDDGNNSSYCAYKNADLGQVDNDINFGDDYFRNDKSLRIEGSKYTEAFMTQHP